MTLRLVDRYHPRLRSKQQAVIDAGQLRQCDEMALLAPEQLRPLARLSLLLLLIGLIFFVALDLLVLALHHQLVIQLTIGGIALGLLINILGYIVILPVHEALHGLAFVLWGGRPHFGTKLPLALYCGARGQLFRRDHYLVVGLAPLVVITLAGIIFTMLAPSLAVYTLCATAGNLSGAAGDVLVAYRLRSQPASVLVEDTETGYRAWELDRAASSVVSRGSSEQ